MMKNGLLLSLFIVLISAFTLQGQNVSLADHYFERGEYEKALSIYEDLYEKSQSDYYFRKLISALREMERYNDAEKIINKRLDKDPNALNSYVYLGQIKDLQGNGEEAEDIYNKAINKLSNSRAQIVKLSNAFSKIGLYDMTIRTMERGSELLNDPHAFAYNLAEYCRREGEKEKMVKYYLLALESNPNRLRSVKTMMQRYLEEEDLAMVQEGIFERISEGENNKVFPELLSWVAIQREDYGTAFRQMRALDIRLDENGKRLYEIGGIARNAGEYETAIKSFKYIIDNKPKNSSYYIPAQMSLLNTKVEKINSSTSQSREELEEVDMAYDTLLNDLGENRNSVHLMLDQARFNAFQLGNIDKAVKILEKIIDMPTANPRVHAQAKLELADFLLIQGDRWEATLLYSQVDKSFPEQDLGERARFKNAKLSYYTGEFNWAKEQFDILKAATSRLLSNDAIDMSVFIADNLNLDTTAKPLQMYADAEFLLFQKKHDSAIQKLDSLMSAFPDHSLQDDIKYLKAKIYEDHSDYQKAITNYNYVVEEHSDEIRADNALYRLAKIYDEQLGNTSKALELYEKLFLEYQGSTFAVFARERFREINGDVVQ